LVKLPRTPPVPLTLAPGDIKPATQRLWRIHRTRGEHVLHWNALRRWGPTSSRYDPQESPPGPSSLGVTYLAGDVTTALAEVFQQTRVIDTAAGAPYLTGWTPARTLQLLDLTGDWPLRHLASQVLMSGPKSSCRAWSRAIASTFPDLDGLWAQSSLLDGSIIVLFNPAADAFPERPDLSLPLDAPGLADRLAAAADRIGYWLA